MVSKKKIEQIINETIQDYNPLNTKCSIIKSSPYYTQALKMSEKYGLRLKRCTKDSLRFEEEGHINPLNDRITSTELRFDAMLNDGHIDFTNENEDIPNGIYSLDTMLGYYTTMPFNLKSSVGLIDFEPTDEDNHSTIYDPNLRRENVITITNEAYRTDVGEEWNPERIMAHEMGHCLEFGQLTSEEKTIFAKNFKAISEDGVVDETFFEEFILPKMHIYSRDKIPPEDYWQYTSDGMALPFDNYEIGKYAEVQGLGDMLSKYGSSFAFFNQEVPSVRLSEDFAETVSMLAFRDKEDKSNAKIDCSEVKFFSSNNDNKLILDYDQFLTGENSQRYIRPNKRAYFVVEELLYGDHTIEGLSPKPKTQTIAEYLAEQEAQN